MADINPKFITFPASMRTVRPPNRGNHRLANLLKAVLEALPCGCVNPRQEVRRHRSYGQASSGKERLKAHQTESVAGSH
jgi:hypothetical protein